MTNDKRDEMIQATHDAVIAIETGCKQCREQVAAHDRALRGNGKPGLAVRVSKLELLVCSMGAGVVVLLFRGLVAWGFGKL